jgi:hypothetical protein
MYKHEMTSFIGVAKVVKNDGIIIIKSYIAQCPYCCQKGEWFFSVILFVDIMEIKGKTIIKLFIVLKHNQGQF